MLVQNMFCNGSHGISVGSLGQYPGHYDIVENIYVFNTSMHNATVSSSEFPEILKLIKN
jgi:galacturan 1,4-alpha-galacturonidase